MKFIFLILTLLSACKSTSEKPRISEEQYLKQAAQLISIPLKLLEIGDATKMNRMALGLLRARTINCETVTNECMLYSKIMNRIVSTTKDGEFNDSERNDIKDLFIELRDELEAGKIRLHENWQNYYKNKK